MPNTDAIWEKYKACPTEEIRNQLILSYLPLVKRVSRKLYGTLSHYTYELGDFYAFGIFGLIDAIEKYNPDTGIKFETYASFRIRGAIIDHVRRISPHSNTIAKRVKKIKETENNFYISHGRKPTEEEIASITGYTAEQIRQAILIGRSPLLIDEPVDDNNTLSDILEDTKYLTPEEKLEEQELKEKIREALSMLTEKERATMILIYYQDLSRTEAGKIMNVSESRVSQLHKKALTKLKKPIGEYYKEVEATA